MEPEVRLKVLARMAQSESDEAKTAVEREIRSAAAILETETDYARLENSLAILQTIGFRSSEVAVSSIVEFANAIERRQLSYSEDRVTVEALREYRTPNSLIVRAIEALTPLRYWQTQRIVRAVIPLSEHRAERVRKQAINALELVASYDLSVFYGDEGRPGIGSGPQEVILNELEQMQPTDTQKYLIAVSILLEKLLSAEMEGTQWTYNTLTLTRVGTPAASGIPEIRSRSIELLKRTYSLALDVKQKLRVVSVLTSATRTSVPKASGQSREMFERDSLNVLAFFTGLAVEPDLQVVQKIEHNGYWIFHHADTENIRTAALRVQAAIAANSEYQTFRALIGFEGVFGEWHEVMARAFDPSNLDELRKGLAREYIDGITDESFSEWRARILKYAAVQSDDLATFAVFYYFLENLAIKKPSVAVRLLAEDSQALSRFLIPLFRGLWAGPEKSRFRELLVHWISQDRYLYAATKQFLSNSDVDLELLRLIYHHALKINELGPIREMVSVTLSNYSKGRASLVNDLMLPALKALTEAHDATWVFDAWFRNELAAVCEDLSEESVELILINLEALQKIEYHAERVLTLLANKWPEKVVQFFVNRLQREAHQVVLGESRFEPIPFEFDELRAPLARVPAFAVDAVRKIYDGHYGSFIYGGARLLRIIFPEFPSEFEAELLKLIHRGHEADIEFVLSVLRNYDGLTSIQTTCKEIVKSLPSDSQLLADVGIALENTGVVSGEFGMAEAYERKATEIADWLSDPNEKVRQFASRYTEQLQAMSSAERRRAQEQIELGKFKYGET